MPGRVPERAAGIVSGKTVARTDRVVRIELEGELGARRNADAEHEREIAIFDLLDENRFSLSNGKPGPYVLHLSIIENRLVFDVRSESDEPLHRVGLALGPFRRVVKDYFTVCEAYYEAIKHASLSQIEAIDMGRRGLHNEASELLRARLAGKIDCDAATARRLFTLLCALHASGREGR